MNPWILAGVFLFLIPLQATLMNLFSLNGIKPDLGFLFVYFVGFFMGIRRGIFAGAGVGLAYDLFSGGPFGLSFASKAAGGLGAGVLGRVFLNTTAPITMGLILGLSLFSGLVAYFYNQAVWGEGSLLETTRWTLLPESLYNSVLGGFIYWIGSVRRLFQKPAGSL